MTIRWFKLGLVLTAALAIAAPIGFSARAMDILAPRDIAYPAPITLAVDATDVTRGIFKIEETIPVTGPGPQTLLYPEWLPGNHAPRGPIDKVAGLTISAAGRLLTWRRDPLNVYAYHVDVPAGATQLDIRFLFVSPTATAQGRVVATPVMLNLQWNQVALYPAGYNTARIPFDARVTLPDGWKHASGLDTIATDGATTRFATTDFTTLVDSPVFAGKYFRQIDLDPGSRVPFRLNIVADRADQLAATDAQITLHRALVRQTYRLFGPGRFAHYDFLQALSDSLGGIGLEHLRSSENNNGAAYYTEWDATVAGRYLLGHELTHAWNGKFRRPRGLHTASFDVPMQNDLLWVYEGQTQYWGHILTARSGLWTKQNWLDSIAMVAATYDNRVGRSWRALSDTTYEPIISARRPEPWRSFQRPEDYYSEGALIWLDADTLIRERTGGRRSLDDFARAFFRAPETGLTSSPYDFEDVVATLNTVMPYDWATFLRTRVDAVGGPAPLDGIARGGYRIIYATERSELQKAQEKRAKNADFMYSLGFIIGEDKKLTEVLWDSPAFNAGLSVGVEVIAVNGVAYDADVLRRAITAAKSDGKPVEILIKAGNGYRTIAVPYADGLRYPRLERAAGTPDRLSAILAPRR